MFVSSRKHIGRSLKVGAVLLVLFAQSAILLPSLADTPLITPIDFTGFDGSGFAPSPAAGQLDSDIWRVTGMSDGDGTFGGTHTTGDFARGSKSGGVSFGGVYAFDVGIGDIILGIQPIEADFTPGDITLVVTNTTGSTAANVYISYEIWTLNNEERANSLNFSYALDDSAIYTDVAELNFTTPEAADPIPAWSSTTMSTTITGINLANNAAIYLKWTGDDVSGSGSRDEYGIDDIEVEAHGPTAVTLSSFTATSSQVTSFRWQWVVLAGAVVAFGGGAVARRSTRR